MDKVKLYAQERLDLDDTRALQSLTEDYLQESFGALLGFGGGALSVPVVTTEESGGSPYITFSPFTFLTTTPNFDRGAAVSGGTQYTQNRARIVNYDPAEESAPEIDITALRGSWDVIVATFGAQYVWARPILVDTDTGTRRKWDVTSGTETTFSAQTRTSQRVEFVIQNAEPSYAEGESRWTKIGQVTGWTDGTNAGSEPQFQWYSVFDSPDIYAFLNNAELGSLDPLDAQMSLTGLMESFADFPFSEGSSLRAFGVIAHLAAVRRQLARVLSTGSNDPAGTPPSIWHGAPLVSLGGAHARLTELETRMTGGVQCIASAQVVVNVDTASLNSFVASYTGPSYGVDRTHSIIHVIGQQQNRANIALSSAVLAEGWAVTHVDVTQIELKYALDPTEPDHYDYNRVSFVVDPSAYTEDTTDGATMILDNGAGAKRGVVVEFLPWIMDDGLHAHSEDSFHAPNGIATDSTKVLDRWANTSIHLRFSVAVYAVASANADT